MEIRSRVKIRIRKERPPSAAVRTAKGELGRSWSTKIADQVEGDTHIVVLTREPVNPLNSLGFLSVLPVRSTREEMGRAVNLKPEAS